MPGRVPGLDAAMEPGLRDRENLPQAQLRAHVDVAAMEPGLRDRENKRPVPKGTRVWVCRNGARPERPGKLAPQAEWHYPGDSRNGARPERPGKHGAKGTPLEIPLAPQWSPA